MNGQAGKGDSPRPVDREKYEQNWENIFRKKKREICDGFGSCWTLCEKKDCALEIVRPGKVQCNLCDQI
jgi:hypothetical protein